MLYICTVFKIDTMSIALNNIRVEFGGFVLLKKVSFLISAKDKIGLVGRNGAGKSTILKIINGIQNPSSGDVAKPKDVKIGYLPQHMNCDNTLSVIKETEKAFSDVKELKTQIDKINQQIAERTDYESKEYANLIDKLTLLNERYAIVGGENGIAQAEKVLIGLGFKRSDFDRSTAELSGGWRMRIELAKILLIRPDVILLDEPTNHLDIESIQWLEDFLKTYSGAVVLISHDRRFLDSVTNRTIEISLGDIYDYKTPYSKFLELRKERREQQMSAYINQQKMIKETEEFIERFRYKATKAVQVQSRIKQLEKIDRIEIDEEDTSKLNIKFAPAPRSGNDVIEIKELSKSYGETHVIDEIDMFVERGEKLAFVGKNGEGKTTLSRVIIGELEHTGLCRIGHNVKIGYFAQNQADMLDVDKTVFQTIDDVATGDYRTKVRDMLGAFMFKGDDVDKKVKVLSGGEKTRLAMIKLLLEPYNLLVMDEPTNHLDLQSKDMLKNALKIYDGTLIIVSHDRHFLEGLPTKIYEFKDKKVKEHIGDINEFLRVKKLDNMQQFEKKDKVDAVVEETSVSDNKQRYEERKVVDREIRKVKKEFEKTESEIESLEEKISELEEKMNTSSDTELFTQYDECKKSLQSAMDLWEKFSMQLEELEEKKEAI